MQRIHNVPRIQNSVKGHVRKAIATLLLIPRRVTRTPTSRLEAKGNAEMRRTPRAGSEAESRGGKASPRAGSEAPKAAFLRSILE